MNVWIVAFVVLLANIASAEQGCGAAFDKKSVKFGTEANGFYTGDNDIVKVIFKMSNSTPFDFDTLNVVPIENIDVLTIAGKASAGDNIKAKFTDVPNPVTDETVIQKTGEFETTTLIKLVVSGKSKNGGAPKFQITASTACLVPKAAQKVQSFASVVKEDGESQVTGHFLWLSLAEASRQSMDNKCIGWQIVFVVGYIASVAAALVNAARCHYGTTS